MHTSFENKHLPISQRLYGLMLLVYPAEFRREFGSQMIQVFRDCYRAETGERRGAPVRFWFSTLVDLAITAVREHADNSGRENSFMNNLRREAVALFLCIGIIVVALTLLTYGRKHDVSSILLFGYALDAVVTAGIIGNLIVFLLVKTTRFNPLRTALWTFLAVHTIPVIFLALIVGQSDPRFSLGNVVIGYVVSFLFWFGLHWAWAKSGGPLTASNE